MLRRRLDFTAGLLFALAAALTPLSGMAAGGWGVAEGYQVPKTTLMTAYGEKHELTSYAAKQQKKNLLLIFFRTGTCGICVGQLSELARLHEEVGARNAAMLAISLDDAIVQKDTSEKIQNRFPILLDPDAKTVRAFDVFNPEDKLSRPSLFLIGPKGRVEYKYVGKHLTDRPNTQTILDVLQHYSGGLAKARNLTGK